ncbi:MAG: type II secretion system F family protein [Nitrospirae bacterium]|nr:type II secretion system F family protein [Nitrospirota bacterium]
MPNFKYLAYNTKGREISGKTFSRDEDEAIVDLRKKGLYVKEIGKDEKSGFRLEKGLSISDIFINLSAMISSGVLVPAAIQSISGETVGNVKKVMEDVYNNVVKGLSLSGAMELRKDFFPQYAASMVRAGEESGRLDIVLASLAGFLEREKELKDKVRSALIYPIFMVTVSLLLIFFVFVFVFPKVTGIFMDQKIPLPYITRIFMGLSNFLYGYWYLLIIAAAAAFFSGRVYYRKQTMQISKKLFYSPLKSFRNLSISRFCRVLSLLLAGGVPIIKALEYSRDVSGSEYLASEIDRIKKEVKEGKKLSDLALFLPPTFLQLVITGEKTGGLEGPLERIADMAERDFRKSIDNFLRVLEPSIILVMGAVVGFMVISILLPIFQMNQIIK